MICLYLKKIFTVCHYIFDESFLNENAANDVSEGHEVLRRLCVHGPATSNQSKQPGV